MHTQYPHPCTHVLYALYPSETIIVVLCTYTSAHAEQMNAQGQASELHYIILLYPRLYIPDSQLVRMHNAKILLYNYSNLLVRMLCINY